MRRRLISGMLACLVLVCALSLGPAIVFAHDGEHSTEEMTTLSDEKTNRGEELKSKLQELKTQRQENRQHRLEQNKLRVCEQRKAKVASIMNRAIIRAERQLKVFNTIAERVKAFYVDKGLSVANYDELVAAVDTAKADAEANLETLKDLEPFDCNAEDPKGGAEAFKLALRSINEDLKDYRTAIKNLIVAVKSANSASGEEGGQ